MTTAEKLKEELFEPGIRPYDPGREVEEPVYADRETERVFQKLYRNAAFGIKELFGNLTGFEPVYRNLKVRMERLPTIWEYVIDLAEGTIRKTPVAKIMGQYDDRDNTIILDPEADEEVVGHELTHRAQDVFGILESAERACGSREKAIPYIEGMTAWIGDRIGNKSHKIYTEWKQQYQNLVNRLGPRKALSPAYV